MTDDNGLRPAEQAILEQIETRIGMTRAALAMVEEALDQIERQDLLRVMATPDERQASLIAMLPHYDAGLAGLAGLHMVLEVVARVATIDDPPEPDGDDIEAMFDGLDDLLGGQPGGHRFTAGPDGEVEEQA